MSDDSKKRFSLPRIGLRNIKTAIATTLCVFIYAIIDRNATFACIGAVFAMNTDLQSSWETGGNRLWGSIIGGFAGMFFFNAYKQLTKVFDGNDAFWETLMMFFGIITMIYISQLFKVHGSIPSGSVVFFIVMLNTPENQYVTYALNRMLDTAIGVFLSLMVNVALPRELFTGAQASSRLNELEDERARIDRDIVFVENLMKENNWDSYNPQ